MRRKNLKIILLLLAISALMTGCIYHSIENPRFVERLNSQIRDEKFEDIYNESSGSAKRYKYSKEQFIGRLTMVREKMKEVDESLVFQKLENRCGDEGVYRDDNFACRFIEANGRRINIDIWLDASSGGLILVDLCIWSEEIGDRLCVSDASRS